MKMEAKDLKAGIAKYLLGRISTKLTANLPDNPFSKVIKLPEMMGLDSGGMLGNFIAGPPVLFWKK